MVSTKLATVLGLLGAASASPKPAPRSVPAPANIAAITSVDQSAFTSYQTGGLKRAGNATAAINGAMSTSSTQSCAHGTNALGACCADTPQFTWGDTDGGGWGISLENGDSANYRGFYFYENDCDLVPYKYTWLAGGASNFITLPVDFQGRMTRGTDAMNLAGVSNRLGTWFEFNWEIDPAGIYTGIWGDISLIRGCDNGMLTWTEDGSGAWKGFTYDIMADAPSTSWQEKPDGAWCLGGTEDGGSDDATDAYELSVVGPTYAYIDDAHGSPVIFSKNGRLGLYAVAGIV